MNECAYRHYLTLSSSQLVRDMDVYFLEGATRSDAQAS